MLVMLVPKGLQSLSHVLCPLSECIGNRLQVKYFFQVKLLYAVAYNMILFAQFIVKSILTQHISANNSIRITVSVKLSL